jgi:hypothetical protein
MSRWEYKTLIYPNISASELLGKRLDIRSANTDTVNHWCDCENRVYSERPTRWCRERQLWSATPRPTATAL